MCTNDQIGSVILAALESPLFRLMPSVVYSILCMATAESAKDIVVSVRIGDAEPNPIQVAKLCPFSAAAW